MNFTALFSRLIKTWRIRLSSTVISGKSWGILWMSWMRLVNACCLINAKLDLHKLSILTAAKSRLICPDSIFATSRMSLINAKRWVLLVSTVRNALSCRSLMLPNISSCRASFIPRIELSGVRSSWLILARNSSLRRVARISSWFANCNFASADLRSLISCTLDQIKNSPLLKIIIPDKSTGTRCPSLWIYSFS